MPTLAAMSRRRIPGSWQPGLVLLISAAGQVPQAGCLLGADAVLGPGVGPVPDFQAGELAAAGVGEERGEPVPADIGEPQLRAGVRPFPADDQRRSFRPGGQVDAAGDLGDLRAVAGLAVDVMGRVQARAGTRRSASCTCSSMANPRENEQRRSRTAAANRCVAPAASALIRTAAQAGSPGRGRARGGSAASAMSSTLT